MLVIGPTRNVPEHLVTDLIPDDESMLVKCVEHVAEIDLVIRKDVQFQLARFPYKAPFPIAGRPQTGERNAQRQTAGALRLEQTLVAEEVRFDRTDACHQSLPAIPLRSTPTARCETTPRLRCRSLPSPAGPSRVGT